MVFKSLQTLTILHNMKPDKIAMSRHFQIYIKKTIKTPFLPKT